jgi:hypothetical protein
MRALRNTVLLVTLASSTLAVSACTTDPPAGGETPATTFDGLDERDQGVVYNGWYQWMSGAFDAELITATFTHNFTRSSGDTARGGGGCLVRKTGRSCSDDSTCTTQAQTLYGASAWGYCYSGACYDRPGSQATHCALNPNRSAANGNMTLTKAAYPVAHTFNQDDYYTLGCMTKTAGPNTACGGTDTSLYMRVVSRMDYVVQDPCGGSWCGNGCC